MDSITHILYIVSGALLYPVILALLGLSAAALLEIGGVVREAFDRRRNARVWPAYCDALASARSQTPLTAEQTRKLTGLLSQFVQSLGKAERTEIELEKSFADLELSASAAIARLNLFARLSPMLGLAGTLIPLGPALLGISQGDLESLSRNLVVAFSTTVLGLFAGGVFFAIGTIRRQWYARDLGNIEYLLHQMTAEAEPMKDPVYA